MTIRLPELFVARMKELLKGEFPAFLASYEEPRHYGLRLNTLKCDKDHFAKITPFRLASIPWCETGYFYEEEDRPGKHPYYHAGLYYIQEPSAMAPVELLDVRPGDRVLDLCAAPGGKSIQIACKLGTEGVLVTNDNHRDRVKPLLKNVELSGVSRAIVLNETPDRLVRVFEGYFDRILVDAPCSGEGMFRKEEEMAKAWDRHSVQRCAAMQKDILKDAAKLLAPGGRLVYSTCTFAPEENEGQIAAFLQQHLDFRLVPVSHTAGLSRGRPEWVQEEAAFGLEGAARIWPHQAEGEGHFIAVLERAEGSAGILSSAKPAERMPARAASLKEAARKPANRSGKGIGGAVQGTTTQELTVRAFLSEYGIMLAGGELRLQGDRAYWLPNGVPDLSGLRIVRTGLLLGECKPHRFQPSQALAMACEAGYGGRRLNLTMDKDRETVIRYLKGETIELDDLPRTKGWTLVCVDGFPLGWGRVDGTILKNDYPPAWRWM